MVISRFTRAVLPATLLALGLATLSHAEEKSLWQKFKDFFSPMPTVEGEGPEYDKLRELDKRINTLEGKYSRERRPNNKANIKKELDALKAERAALEEQIRKNPPQPSSSAAAPQSEVPTCKTDTVFVRDTVVVHDVVHDTLYVIVADKKAEGSAPVSPAVNSATSAKVQDSPAAPSAPAATTDSASVQPGTK
ncbi:MAG: hypothetical protein IKC23_06785 [Fibrobacter sp.]|nr:hypothetical protein [Fibrobacter sp.]